MTANRRYTVHSVQDRSAFTYRMDKAINQRTPVTIEYTKLDGSESLRTIDPYESVTTLQGRSIVRALDRKTGEIRAFRVDRISAYTVHKGKTRLEE